jgi:hypothetical protein
MQYAGTMYRREVFVPAGAKAPVGSTIIRGLGGESGR